MFYVYIVEDETSDNSCGVRQFAKISFNDKDLLGRLSVKKMNDATERIVTGRSGTKTNGSYSCSFDFILETCIILNVF